jgi:hypothetical protein
MPSAFLNKLQLANCTVKETWKDRGELVIKEAGTDGYLILLLNK